MFELPIIVSALKQSLALILFFDGEDRTAGYH